LDSLAFDWLVRQRLGAAALAWYILKECGIPARLSKDKLAEQAARLNLISPLFSPLVCRLRSPAGRPLGVALTPAERTRSRVLLDVLVAARFALSSSQLDHVLVDCAHPPEMIDVVKNRLDSRGFWRIDRGKDPELRHTVLTLVAFHDLDQKIQECAGDREKGVEAFLSQNDGEGWMLPETLRLADYGLGHDDRAKEHQPVASRLGPRFFDWQLTQSADESWRECHVHARNLLGDAGYQTLLNAEPDGVTPGVPGLPSPANSAAQRTLFN
jgi:hypothetical protein